MADTYDSSFERSKRDLKAEWAELEYLYTSYIQKLILFQKRLVEVQNSIPSYSCKFIERKIKHLLSDFYDSLKQVKFWTQSGVKPSMTMYKKQIQYKSEYYEKLRVLINLFAGLRTSLDFQSSSFLHSMSPQAGSQAGQIIGNINDYKRDQHLDELDFQKKFVSEYIDSKYKSFLGCFATSSGMSALTTILIYLLDKISGPVMIGKNSYFENKMIIKKIFGNKVFEVDETRTHDLLKTIKSKRPSVIFLDSLCNETNITIPDIDKIIKYLKKDYRQKIYLVIDNTGMSMMYQPFSKINNPFSNIHLIVWESLNKYYQFGLDRVTGGIMVVDPRDAYKIFKMREHLGTNISDTSVHALPAPNKIMLGKRLTKLSRNAKYLSASLSEFLILKKISFIKIKYPFVNGFAGTYFTIIFNPKLLKKYTYNLFIKSVIQTAKSEKVQLVSGTSFGLNTTRIYLTASNTSETTPFIRVACGTETILEMEKLKLVFQKALLKFKRYRILLS